jgi:hypothetical protein
VALTANGKARCADRVCASTQALLDMQKPVASGKVMLPGGVVVNADALRSRLIAKYGEQRTCEAQPDNHRGDHCPAEEHELAFISSKAGACDTISTFKATAPDGRALKYPTQLENELLWVDRHTPTCHSRAAASRSPSTRPTGSPRARRRKPAAAARPAPGSARPSWTGPAASAAKRRKSMSVQPGARPRYLCQ